MSRSAFVLAVTLLVVAASLGFIMSFDRDQKTTSGPSSTHSSSENQNPTDSTLRTQRTLSSRGNLTRISLPDTSTAHLSNDNLARVQSILSLTQRESRDQLDRLSRQYQLTSEQRRAAFPLIVAHHRQAHPAMIVDGHTLPAIGTGTTLNDSLSSVFDSTQQDALNEASADHDAWWEDIVGQLEGDLDAAIDNGEMVLVDESSPNSGLTISEQPASGDGEASSHSGGNLFDLLGQ